ncbi:hypothetical protein SELMODRAFT_410965 [Selaginella moellendorffii]|uniref:Uncharacterized protein n=1 Tax=Selaginella moellendorffii TaxID=88036 RepID=D8RHK6_SELML|nr:hypothetical protein SELMODRAFT_410965 [Selaginella moellendorffii]
MDASSARKRGREPNEEEEQEEKKRLKEALMEIARLNLKSWEAGEDAELKEQIASERVRASQLQEDEWRLERELSEILQPPPEYLKRVEGIAESAFAQEYQRVGGLDNVELLREKLEETGDMWKAEKLMIAPVVTLVQSSGWGKSRTTCELANLGVFVIYCSFASSGTAYPPRSAFADFFYTNAVKLLSSGPTLLSQSRFMLFCIDYFVSCIEALLQLTSGEDPMDAKKFLNDLMVGENFWGLVQAKMEIGNEARGEFAKRLDVDLKKGPGENTNIWGIWESKVFKKYNTLEGLLSNVPAPAKGKLKVLFAMDEARWFTSHDDPRTVAAFVPARRASRVLPENGSVSVMFTDTNGRLNTFAPPNKASGVRFSSDRVAAAGKLVAHPAYCFFLADLPSDEQTGGLRLAQVQDLGRLCGYGRPLWQALVKASASAGDVLLLAVDKLLGGTGSFNKFLFEGEGLSHEACLATLGCRVCIDINPHATIITDMVASHLLSVMSISDDQTLVWMHWATEPLVAAAAAQVLCAQGKIGRTGWKECLEALVTGMKRGWVDRGYRGELLARVLLLLAVDSLGRSSWKCFTFDELCHGLSGKSLSDLIREDEQNSASPAPKAPGGGEEALVEVNMPPPPASALKRRVKVNKKFPVSLSKAPGEKAQVKVNTPPPEVKSPSPTLTASKAPGGSTHNAEGEGETKQAGGSIDGSGKEEIHRNMGDAKFFCLLFRKTDFQLQDLTAKDLLEFGKAGVGIICRENEWGIDIVIVGFFGDTFSLETMTLILVQMLSSSAGPQGWTGLKVPYASLVLNVAHVPSSSVHYRTRKLVTEALLKKTPANQSMAMALHDAHPECKGLQGWTEGYDGDRSHPVFKSWERYFASDDRLQHIVVIQGLDAFSSKDEVKDLVDISLDSTADMRKLEQDQKPYAHRMFGWVKNTEMRKCLEPKLSVKKKVSDGLCYNGKTNNDN